MMTQLLAKFKNILQVGFRATLNLRKFKNPSFTEVLTLLKALLTFSILLTSFTYIP